jgi:hypothetical protein
MDRYTVLWREELVEKLAGLWPNYHDRSRLSSAADQIDDDLSVDAHLKGSLFKAGQRSLVRGPLVVFFRVDEGDRKVMVEGISLTEAN